MTLKTNKIVKKKKPKEKQKKKDDKDLEGFIEKDPEGSE